MEKKNCPYCRLYKPVSEIRYELRGRGSRKIKKLICNSCFEGRKKHNSLAERDAFGKLITQQNYESQSRLMTNIKKDQQEEEGKTHD